MRRFFLLLCLILSIFVVHAQEAQDIIIQWDAAETTISGQVTLRGTVNPPGLQVYFLEVAPYDAADPLWLPLTLPNSAPVVEDVLGIWDTNAFPPDRYQLRLHVVLTSGESVYYTLGPIGVGVDVEETVSVIERPGPSVLMATPTLSAPSTPAPFLRNELPLEVGAHVLYFSEQAQDYMRQAGMTWVKWQIPFVIGSDTDVARDRIQWAHEAGFKVLLSITGEVEELRELGEDYYPIYAQFLAEIAAFGPDAIEVWNEMNIDREWPQGRIDPRAYAVMLQEAYTAIKAVDPNVLVITGALAPTGAEGAFGLARVWNDDRYYLGMANAGVAEYADCIGVHYNEGILPPTAQGGDPRDTYPTRYFPLMLERVAWPFRNSDIPLCFTELGYLSPEGYGRLPANFAWAANTSVAEQAEWLAGAIQLAANYQRLPVRLVIIWNMDFDSYGDDPQAGYAIIRPDGTCPACMALAALRRPQ